MNYQGRIFGKVGKKYFELEMTTQDVGDLQAQLNTQKQDFYSKLLAKLEKIKAGELFLDDYIAEVTKKITL